MVNSAAVAASTIANCSSSALPNCAAANQANQASSTTSVSSQTLYSLCLYLHLHKAGQVGY